MTTFRIREYVRPDGKTHYRVQQWRWLPFPYWSSTYFYSNGGANYLCETETLEEARVMLAGFVSDTRQKINSRPWNFVRTTISTVKVLT